jgi:alpha-ketoglutarate-dependent sulfate ester dioxygenase
MTVTAIGSAAESGASSLEVHPLTPRIGAEISNVDLASEVTDEVISDIRATLLRYRVVFFRDQPIDHSRQTAFARRFGDITIGHPTVPGPDGLPEIFELDSSSGARADHWHTDVTFTDRPPTLSVLRAVVIPTVGGDTLWANTVAAYSDLPSSIQSLVDGLRAVHTNTYDYANPKHQANEARRRHLEIFTSTVFETEHPVVRVHPETNERALLLGGFAQRIVGLAPNEGHELLRLLSERVTRPENTVRWRWQEGDVAIWDNRATQHYAINDYGDARRIVQRVTVAGSIPVGLDGRVSQALVGDAELYSAVGAK